MTHPSTNPVGFLQEFCMQHSISAGLPKYEEVCAEGPAHSRFFTCKCTFDGREAVGKGSQKKQAKFDAAKAMVQMLEDDGYFKHGSTAPETAGMNSSLKQSQPKISPKNPISQLQEYCQTNRTPMPDYVETSTEGGFVCECRLMEYKTYGHGTNKKAAKTESAVKMCVKMELFSAEESYKAESAKLDMSLSEKNPISALHELCSSRRLPQPSYEPQANPKDPLLFVMKCSVGKFSAEGSDTTKKGAKLLATHKVLGMLLENKYSYYMDDSVSILDALHITDVKLEGSIRKLEEFSLNSSDEEGDTKDRKPEIPNEHSMSNGLANEQESLALNDSVVEVEPSSVVGKKETVVVKKEPEDETACGQSHQIPSSGTLLKWAKNH